MRIPIFCFILLGAGSVIGQTGSTTGGTSAQPVATPTQNQRLGGATGTTGAGNQILNNTTPVLGSPVAGSAVTGTGTDATVVPSAVTTPQQGIAPINPIVPPLDSTPGGTVDNLLSPDIAQDQIVDPAGANATQGPLSTAGTSGTTPSTVPTVTRPSAVTDAFVDQFGASIGQNGSTLLAFPNENAVVTVISTDGNLTLQGAVSSEQQRLSIENAIRSISGGSFINNQIQINSGLNLNSLPNTTTTLP